MVLAARHFEVYLGGRCSPIKVYTIHNPSDFLSQMSNSNQRVTRRSLLLQEYNLDIKHRKGSGNVDASLQKRSLVIPSDAGCFLLSHGCVNSVVGALRPRTYVFLRLCIFCVVFRCLLFSIQHNAGTPTDHLYSISLRPRQSDGVREEQRYLLQSFLILCYVFEEDRSFSVKVQTASVTKRTDVPEDLKCALLPSQSSSFRKPERV